MSNVTKLSIVSGLFAAFGAMFGKLATSPSIYRSFMKYFIFDDDSLYFEASIRMIQALSVMGMFLSNTIMWSQFSLALSLSSTTIYVIVTNTLSNFICTAIVGLLLFGERITFMWSVGIVCLLIGIVLLKDQQGERKQQEQKMNETTAKKCN